MGSISQSNTCYGLMFLGRFAKNMHSKLDSDKNIIERTGDFKRPYFYYENIVAYNSKRYDL